jgi:hypothetical protein
MKYRIMERIDGNGESHYEVQEKILWWWWNEFTRHTTKENAEEWVRSLQTKEIKYHTVEQ